MLGVVLLIDQKEGSGKDGGERSWLPPPSRKTVGSGGVAANSVLLMHHIFQTCILP